MKQLTKEEALRLAESNFWENMTPEEITEFQLFQNLLCMPFGVFHEAIEKTLKRPVFTHEFAHANLLEKEFLGEKSAPTFEEIINLIPVEKRIILAL